MGKIFSIDYYPAGQNRFERLLGEGKLKEAAKILDNMFHAHTTREKIMRNGILMEGYKALVREYQGSELEEYKKLGSVNEIKHKLTQLENIDEGLI